MSEKKSAYKVQDGQHVDTKNEGLSNPICGIIMPISPTEGYSALHWSDVRKIIDSVVIDAGFIPNIVSDADDVGIIHNRIVKNLAENPIVICDVSSKNPNVMFELGLRLAFDKATIIIKDELTSYNFDTSPIEHLSYPSDLHYHQINDFKQKLKDKLLKTYEAAKDAKYSTFLKNFINYKRELQTEEVSNQDYIIKQFERLFGRLNILESMYKNSSLKSESNERPRVFIPNSPPPSLINNLAVSYKEYLKDLNIKDFNPNMSPDEKMEHFFSYLLSIKPEFMGDYSYSQVRKALMEIFV